jgi:predicted nucleic acid-binding protein
LPHKNELTTHRDHAPNVRVGCESFIWPSPTKLRLRESGDDATVVYGRVRAALEAQGTPIGALDMLIAAQAPSLDVTLVTNNTRELSRIPDLKPAN